MIDHLITRVKVKLWRKKRVKNRFNEPIRKKMSEKNNRNN